MLRRSFGLLAPSLARRDTRQSANETPGLGCSWLWPTHDTTRPTFSILVGPPKSAPAKIAGLCARVCGAVHCVQSISGKQSPARYWVGGSNSGRSLHGLVPLPARRGHYPSPVLCNSYVMGSAPRNPQENSVTLWDSPHGRDTPAKATVVNADKAWNGITFPSASKWAV